MVEEQLSDLFPPEIIYSKKKTMKLRKSEFYNEANDLVSVFVVYKEIPPNNTPIAAAVVINEKRNYGITLRKGKDRFWRVTAVFSTSDKDKKFRNYIPSSPIIIHDKGITTELFNAEEDMPEIRKI